MFSSLEGTVRALGDKEGNGKLAAEALAKLFPGGLRPVVQQIFEEQLAEEKTIIASLGGELADHVTALALTPQVAKLEGLVHEFAAELERVKAPEIAFDRLRGSRHHGNSRVRQIVGKILGTYNELTDEHEKIRVQLLAPIIDQARRATEAARRGVSVIDVDPETGEDVVDPTTPAEDR